MSSLSLDDSVDLTPTCFYVGLGAWEERHSGETVLQGNARRRSPRAHSQFVVDRG
jgi:hypothetical protein